MRTLRAFWRATDASTAVEFALLSPLLLTLMIGTIDIGRYLWTVNRAQKATQMGARWAVATDVVPSGLATYDFAVAGGIPQGDPIPASSFTSAKCSSTLSGTVTCVCVPTTCPGGSGVNTAAFNRILFQMQQYYPEITADKLKVNYEYSGLGYAGDPNGIQVQPLVTVQLVGMTFAPILYRFFSSGSITLNTTFSSSLTLEDGSGQIAN
ncbi:pilus assembly protein [Sphingomonas panacisoli]|uniref:Pilus assembly protein n=1 Tax=Sphingomonas panacisoli TaxID=1813879 RepID=A0A5B8LK76_9SPHN|nr:TadE/TadG family type IV pilus assembly protein [Sphingomonas panacisoli]QDZ08648.1 pilus assembly protein [Sphingomonas panacisoli]